MKFYHGSCTGNIETLLPFASSHGRPYVYLTNSEVLAAIYAANPMKRPNGWFPYWWNNGQLFYDEYYEGQLEEIYRGKTGYLYTAEGNFPNLEKMPWVFLSEAEVPVGDCRVIPDLYEQLLHYEAEGRLTIRRWKDHSETYLAHIRKVIENSLPDSMDDAPPSTEYREFVYARFPALRR